MSNEFAPEAATRPGPLRFLFVTLGHVESDFYGRVGEHLRAAGHEVAHLTFSRRAALRLQRSGFRAWCLPELHARNNGSDPTLDPEVVRRDYAVPTFRSLYLTDVACRGRPDGWCVARALDHVRAIRAVYDEWRPDVVIPEVGNETIRVVACHEAVARKVRVLLLFYTIFPDPLRLYVDFMQRPIVSPDELTEPAAEEQLKLDAFVSDLKARRKPIREPRNADVTLRRAAILLRHVGVKAIWDRDNDYLTPLTWVRTGLAEKLKARASRWFYDEPPAAPFVYFPLHVSDDYKIAQLLPHCRDQAAIIELVSASLPVGYKLVAKEHPLSIGRTSLGLLRRLRRTAGVSVVAADANSHDLIERSAAVVVISSTVGLEALVYGKPVLTLGQPFYAGMGITVDSPDLSNVPVAVPQVLDFRPDADRINRFLVAAMRRCRPGAPVLVDRSDTNAERLARSLDEAGRALRGESVGTAAPI